MSFPDDYGAEDLAGKQADFAVTVKEVKAKELPEVDDDLAAEAGFDTLDELRDDIRERLSEGEERRIEAEFREAVLDSAVANATVDVPDALVEARARELWDQMLHSLSHQGISKEMYLQISGRDEDDIVTEGKADAERQLKREAVLAAVVAAERDRAERGGGARGARGGRAVREHEREEAARADEVGRPPGCLQGRAREPQGARSAGRVRHPDQRRAGPGARQAVDPRQRRRGALAAALDTRVLNPLWRRSRVARLAPRRAGSRLMLAVKDSGAERETKRGP